MKPVVSIILACYNKENFIEKAIISVLEQTFQNFELIVVDDGSKDKSVDKIKEALSKDERLKLIENYENKGANWCRNVGIKEAVGDYLIFFDGDDILGNTCLEKRVEFMNEYPNLDFSVFTMQVFNATPGDRDYKWTPNSKKPLVDFLMHKLPWQTMQPIWKKEFIVGLGGFDEKFQRLQDVEIHTRALLKKNAKYDLISADPDCFYRIDEERKNFDTYTFLKRWVDSAILYCDKFKDLIRKKEKLYLLGTIYQTELQIIYQRKNNKISKEEFEYLMKSLNASSIVKELSSFKKMILNLARAYNLYLFRIPGVNKLIKYCLKL